MVNIEEKLSQVRYNVDKEPHIKVDASICKKCPHHACTFICPAGCYTLSDDSELLFSHSGCLECGTCKVICDQGSVIWNYPKGGSGVSFRFT